MTECNHDLEYYYTKDELLPFGNIVSTVVCRCTKCNKEFLEGEINESTKSERNNTNKSE